MLLVESLRSLSLEPLQKLLARTHAEYAGEGGKGWWRLVRDAYEHGGGFRAGVEATTGDAYGAGSYEGGARARARPTYLVQFPRESQDSFQQRVTSAIYENHVAPIVDQYHGHVTRRAPARTSSVQAVADWWTNADARGTHVDSFLARGLLRAQLYGGCACLFDRPAGAFARSEVRTVARWLEPEEVRDWEVDADGALVWVKLVSERTERDPVTGARTHVTECTLWTRTEWARVVVHADLDAAEGAVLAGTPRVRVALLDGAEHGLGRVPLAILRWQPRLDAAALYGLSQVNDVVPLVVRLFNVLSELDHHLRNAVFALLCVQSNDPKALNDLVVGTNNALRYQVDEECPSFISAPAEVAASLAARAEQVCAAIWTAAKLERPRAVATGGDVASGVAKGYDFQKTEAALVAFVGQLAAWEYEAAGLVALWDQAPVESAARVLADTTAKTAVEYPARFDVASLVAELSAQLSALDDKVREQLPPIVRKLARLAIARRLNPEADDTVLRAIEAEAELVYQRERKAIESSDAPPNRSTATTSTPGSSP